MFARLAICVVPLLVSLSIGSASVALAGDWTAFRGSDRNGRTGEKHVPLHWSADKNIKWRVPMPGPGNSSPVIVGDRVLLTCATDKGKSRGTYCFALNDGKQIWSQLVRYDADDPTHGTNPYCGSSPACTADRVVVWHGSAGVRCYDLEGKELWARDLGLFHHIWGYGSSPVIYDNLVLLNCGPGPRQFVTALDLKNGETVWQSDVPGGDSGAETLGGSKPAWTGSWSTPIVVRVDGSDQVIVSLPKHVQAYDPRSGNMLWSIEGLGPLAYNDPLTGDGLGIAMSGFHGAAMGFRLGGSGDMTDANRLWHHTTKNPQRIGSGVLIDGRMYLVNEIGVAQCLDAKTGQELWTSRVPGGKFWSSAIEAEGRIYVTSQSGTTAVFAVNPEKFELLAENPLGGHTNSTLAFSDGKALLRTYEHLVCIEEVAK